VVLAIVDAGPLYAAADRTDPDNAISVAVLSDRRYDLIIPALAVAEVSYLLGTRVGPEAEARFPTGLRDFLVVAPDPADWVRIGDLVRRYGDFPLGGADASVVALAERLDIETIITLDRRHFAAVRPRHVSAFHLVP
jgi:hypothetical protein